MEKQNSAFVFRRQPAELRKKKVSCEFELISLAAEKKNQMRFASPEKYFLLIRSLSTKVQIDSYPLWQYGLWSFQTGGTTLERFLPKNQHRYPKEIFEF